MDVSFPFSLILGPSAVARGVFGFRATDPSNNYAGKVSLPSGFSFGLGKSAGSVLPSLTISYKPKGAKDAYSVTAKLEKWDFLSDYFALSNPVFGLYSLTFDFDIPQTHFTFVKCVELGSGRTDAHTDVLVYTTNSRVWIA
jgi:hypothetical protein